VGVDIRIAHVRIRIKLQKLRGRRIDGWQLCPVAATGEWVGEPGETARYVIREIAMLHRDTGNRERLRLLRGVPPPFIGAINKCLVVAVVDVRQNDWAAKAAAISVCNKFRF